VDYKRIKSIVAFLKENYPQVYVVIGGGLVTADPDYVMAHIPADFGIMGEGDESLPLLVSCIGEPDKYGDIPGLVYKNEERQIIKNEYKDIEDLDELSLPDFTVFPEFEKTIEKSGVYPILLSRSCPFQCSFCFHTSGRKYRVRGTEAVIKEIEQAKELYDIKHLFFLDELFGVRIDSLKPLLRMIKEKGISFNAQTRADTVTEEKLRLFKEYGCTNLSVGIESASDIVLESMGKKLKFKQIEDALLLITKNHIPTSGNIIIGDIAETEETAKKSMDWYAANREKYNLTINMVQCYPGTAIFDHALSRNLMEKETFLEKADLPKDFVLNLTRMPEAVFRNIRKQVNILNFMNEVSRECLVSRNEQN